MGPQHLLHRRPRRFLLLPNPLPDGLEDIFVAQHQGLCLKDGIGVRRQGVRGQRANRLQLLLGPLHGVGQAVQLRVYFIRRDGTMMHARCRRLVTVRSPHGNAGRCARSAGRDTDAREYLRRALERNPRLPSALIESAELALHTARPAQASEYLERYNRVAEASPQTLWLGVRIERALDDPTGAREYGIQLLRRFRDSKQAQRFLETR